MVKRLAVYLIDGRRDGVRKRHGSISKKTRITSKRFIKEAVKHKGSFKRYCKKKGYKGATGRCIKHALAHGSKKRKNQAVLARTLGKFRRHLARK